MEKQFWWFSNLHLAADSTVRAQDSDISHETMNWYQKWSCMKTGRKAAKGGYSRPWVSVSGPGLSPRSYPHAGMPEKRSNNVRRIAKSNTIHSVHNVRWLFILQCIFAKYLFSNNYFTFTSLHVIYMCIRRRKTEMRKQRKQRKLEFVCLEFSFLSCS